VDVSTTAAAIIAGGRARRLGGQEKRDLVVEGRTIIVRQVDVLQRLAHDVFIVGHAPERYATLGLPVHPDDIPGAGVLGGIHTALGVARADAVLVVACDMPFLDLHVLARLVDLSVGHDGAWVRTSKGVEPLVACYRQHARAAVRARIDEGHLKAADLGVVLDMAELGPDELARFGAPDRLLANVNTPEDYARVQYRSS
jgi:molybdopterin-guanine dinucleotide biosynthesis protein A